MPQKLVNCRVVQELTQAIEKLKGPAGDICEKHGTAMHYYCVTCETPLCPDCAMFSDEHKGHEFKHLNSIYELQIKKIKDQAKFLRERHQQFAAMLEEIDGNMDELRKAKDEKTKELLICIEQMQARLEAQYKSKSLTLHAHKSAIEDEIEQLENLHHELNQQISLSSKSDLIKKTPELIRRARELQDKPVSKFATQAINSEFTSEMIPQYESGVFVIKNYSILKDQAEVIYSDNLISNGITWRLKVYPNGNGVAKGTYLSVFLEMVKGSSESTKYEYRVEMMNFLNPSLCVVREFASEFEQGECWGYNKFYKVNQLEEKGYLDPENDAISLRFYVRPPTYYQLCKDQRSYIDSLEKSKNAAMIQLAELRSRFEKDISPKVLSMVFSSNENPLEGISEEDEVFSPSRSINFIDEANRSPKMNTSEANSPDKPRTLAKKLRRLAALRRRPKSRSSSGELTRVLRECLMTPEDVSSSDNAGDDLEHDDLGYEIYSENLISALNAVQQACLE